MRSVLSNFRLCLDRAHSPPPSEWCHMHRALKVTCTQASGRRVSPACSYPEPSLGPCGHQCAHSSRERELGGGFQAKQGVPAPCGLFLPQSGLQRRPGDWLHLAEAGIRLNRQYRCPGICFCPNRCRAGSLQLAKASRAAVAAAGDPRAGLARAALEWARSSLSSSADRGGAMIYSELRIPTRLFISRPRDS
jgi:hypothetical protein